MTGLGETEGTGEGLDAGVCAMWAMVVGSEGKSRQEAGSGVPPMGWSSQRTDLPQVPEMPQDPLIRPNLTSQGASCHGYAAEARQNNPDLGPDFAGTQQGGWRSGAESGGCPGWAEPPDERKRTGNSFEGEAVFL